MRLTKTVFEGLVAVAKSAEIKACLTALPSQHKKDFMQVLALLRNSDRLYNELYLLVEPQPLSAKRKHTFSQHSVAKALLHSNSQSITTTPKQSTSSSNSS